MYYKDSIDQLMFPIHISERKGGLNMKKTIALLLAAAMTLVMLA